MTKRVTELEFALLSENQRHNETTQRLESEIEQLREALRPFANPFAHGEPDEKWFGGKFAELEIDCCVTITYADVARARAALGRKEEA